MNKTGNWSLIAGYLTHSLNPEEEKSLQEWITSDPENLRNFEEAKRIWKLAETKLPLPEIETEKEWQALLEKIESGAHAPQETPVRRLFTWQRIAAAILVLAALFYVLRPTPDMPQLPQAVLPRDTVSSDKFVVRHFLPDSTSVWLNISSKLIHLKEYNREITIIGEAFFDVRKDSVPFIVTAGETRTKVRGTIFNVLARREDSVVVNVTEGQVEFAPSDSARKESVVLGAHDRGTFHSQTGLKKETDIPFADWRKVNNPVYATESENPLSFLRNKYTYKKNVINETQIEGSITNTASLATYTSIRLKIVSTNARGKKTETLLDLLTHGPLSPGKKIDYKHTLFDVFSKKPEVTVKMEHADVIP